NVMPVMLLPSPSDLALTVACVPLKDRFTSPKPFGDPEIPLPTSAALNALFDGVTLVHDELCAIAAGTAMIRASIKAVILRLCISTVSYEKSDLRAPHRSASTMRNAAGPSMM